MTPHPPLSLPQRAAVYWSSFWETGARHEVDPLLLAAICDAESECGRSRQLDVEGPWGKGDHGHGHGLMQIDDRTHAVFLARKADNGAPLWSVPWANIEYATAYCLMPGFRAFPSNAVAAIACYNAGVYRVKQAFAEVTQPLTPSRQLEVANASTFKQNYVTRVLTRYRAFGGTVGALPVESSTGEDSHGSD